LILEQLHSTALMGIETAINQALQYDPATRNAISELDGKVLAVESTLPSLTLFIIHSGDAITLMNHYEGAPDTSLKGSAMALVSLSIDNKDQTTFFDTGVEVRGDTDLLRRVRKIMKNLDIDWIAALAQLIGDIPAHLIGETVQSLGGWRKDAKQRASDVFTGFNQEEAKLTPSRNESEQFFASVRHLNKDVDRLGARMNRLSILLEQQEKEVQRQEAED